MGFCPRNAVIPVTPPRGETRRTFRRGVRLGGRGPVACNSPAPPSAPLGRPPARGPPPRHVLLDAGAGALPGATANPLPPPPSCPSPRPSAQHGGPANKNSCRKIACERFSFPPRSVHLFRPLAQTSSSSSPSRPRYARHRPGPTSSAKACSLSLSLSYSRFSSSSFLFSFFPSYPSSRQIAFLILPPSPPPRFRYLIVTYTPYLI